MSVPNQTPYNIYTANGLTTVFAYEFYLISASDIQVTINGNEVTSGYTVSGVGNTGGGEVTFLSAPANGATVIFERVTPTYRLTDYQDNGDLLADTVNKDFDRLWMAIQRAFIYLGVALMRPLFGGGPFNANGYRVSNLADPVNEQDAATKKFVVDNGNTNLSRTLRVPESDITPLPGVGGRKNKILAFNDLGNPIAVLPESGSAADIMIELAASDGAKLIGGLDFVTPEMMGFMPGSLDDAQPYIQAAIDYAAENDKRVILQGTYYVKSLPYDAYLPYDDGTVYPAWINAGTDANLPPETAYTIKAAFKVPNGTFVEGIDPERTVIEWAGDDEWNYIKPTFTNNGPLCFWIHGDKGVSGLVRYHLHKLCIKSFMIGRLVEGISAYSTEDYLRIEQCGISGLIFGEDTVFKGFIHIRDCWTGDIYGGWWTQRNHTQSADHLPPYPAGDVYLLGWVDSSYIHKYHFYQYLHKWGSYDTALDSWFNAYIYRSQNSVVTASGGRLTNGYTSSTPLPDYNGVAGRSISFLNRYNRAISSVVIEDFKCLGSQRVPINLITGSANYLYRNIVKQAYVERVGLLDTSLNSSVPSNLFYESGAETLSPETTLPSMSTEGNIACWRVTQSGAIPTSPYNGNPFVLTGPEILTTIRKDAALYEIWKVSEWNTVVNAERAWYRFYNGYSIQPAIYFDNDGYSLTSGGKFYYNNKTFTPVVTVGGTPVSLTNANGRYNINGGLLTVHFRITIPAASVTANAIQITNLPSQSATASSGQSSAPVTVIQTGAAVGLTVFARVEVGTQTISFVTDSVGTTYKPDPGVTLTLLGTISYQLNSW